MTMSCSCVDCEKPSVLWPKRCMFVHRMRCFYAICCVFHLSGLWPSGGSGRVEASPMSRIEACEPKRLQQCLQLPKHLLFPLAKTICPDCSGAVIAGMLQPPLVLLLV